MRLLVTRPEPDNARTAQALRAAGHEALLAPLLRIETVRDADPGPGPWAALLLTSANGARAAAAHPRFAEWKDLPVLAVGGGSAAAARAAGFTRIESADGDGGDLARLAAGRFAGQGGRLLYLAGENRARDLAGELAAAGIGTDTLIAYRAVPMTPLPPQARAALAAGTVDGVVHFSRRSVAVYLDGTKDLLGKALAPVHYCLSERTAEPLRLAGAPRIAVATRPDEAALLALVAPPGGARIV